jgi:hypothetical protein
VRSRVWKFWRKHSSRLSLQVFGPIFMKKVVSNPYSGPTW